jgi:spore maturation protein CgeB
MSGIGDYELLVTWWNTHFDVCIDLMVWYTSWSTWNSIWQILLYFTLTVFLNFHFMYTLCSSSSMLDHLLRKDDRRSQEERL